MDDTNKIESMAADLHMLTAPFRLLANLLKVTLFVLAAPLLCAFVVLHYVIGDWDPFYSYLHSVQNASPIMLPFVVLGALLLLVLHMLLIIAKDLGGMLDALLRVPLLGVTLFALVSAFWFAVVRGCYRIKDGKRAKAMSGVIIGFIAAFVAGMYVFTYKDGMPPAALFSLTTLAASSPTLLYLLYRGLKPKADSRSFSVNPYSSTASATMTSKAAGLPCSFARRKNDGRRQAGRVDVRRSDRDEPQAGRRSRSQSAGAER